MLLSGLQCAGRFAGRALKKYWLQLILAIALWARFPTRLDRLNAPFVHGFLVFVHERFAVWQIALLILPLLLLRIVFRTFVKVVNNLGVKSPQLVDKLYSPSFFRATELTTVLDAGFWTAMVFKEGCIRDVASLVFSLYYFIAQSQAREKVRRARAVATLEHLRVSWDKATTPYLQGLGKLLRPKFTKHGPRKIQIDRPAGSSYGEPVRAWLYFDGSLLELQKQTSLVLDIPGGGFVAMNPRTADDRLLAWAGKTKAPILSLDYKKAPEYPYPYALDECYDVYRAIFQTRGACLGLNGNVLPRIAVSGDSAGGNLATSMVLKVLASDDNPPAPEGLVLAYPCLNMKIEAWMTPEQVSLVGNKRMITAGSSDHAHSQDSSTPTNNTPKQNQGSHPEICISSMISFMDDNILTPETMRMLVLLYIGSRNHADFSTDHLLSPVLAPSSLLARLPKTYIVTGERDPMVDDTVVFAGRLRQAKFQHLQQQAGNTGKQFNFNPLDYVHVSLIPGVSHGFLQLAGFWPEGWKYIFQGAGWVSELLAAADGKQRPVFVNEAGMGDLVDEEELLGRRMKFLAGGLGA